MPTIEVLDAHPHELSVRTARLIHLSAHCQEQSCQGRHPASSSAASSGDPPPPRGLQTGGTEQDDDTVRLAHACGGQTREWVRSQTLLPASQGGGEERLRRREHQVVDRPRDLVDPRCLVHRIRYVRRNHILEANKAM